MGYDWCIFAGLIVLAIALLIAGLVYRKNQQYQEQPKTTTAPTSMYKNRKNYE